MDGYSGATAAMNDFLLEVKAAVPKESAADASERVEVAQRRSINGGNDFVTISFNGVAMEIPFGVVVVAKVCSEMVEGDMVRVVKEMERCCGDVFDWGKQVFSPFEDKSELSRMNGHNYQEDGEFEVSDQFQMVLEISDLLNLCSDGRFDPTVVDYLRWLTLEGATASLQEREKRFQSSVGWRAFVSLSQRGVSLISTGSVPVTIDLCAVAKGAIVDAVVSSICQFAPSSITKGFAIVSCFVEWGGDVRAHGRVPIGPSIDKVLCEGITTRRVSEEGCSWRPWRVGRLSTSNPSVRELKDVYELQTFDENSEWTGFSCFCTSGVFGGRLLPLKHASLSEGSISMASPQRLPSFSHANDSYEGGFMGDNGEVCHLTAPTSLNAGNVFQASPAESRRLVGASVLCGRPSSMSPKHDEVFFKVRASVCALADGLASCCLLYDSVDELRQFLVSFLRESGATVKFSSKTLVMSKMLSMFKALVMKVIVTDFEGIEHLIVDSGRVVVGDPTASPRGMPFPTPEAYAIRYDDSSSPLRHSSPSKPGPLDPRQLVGSNFLKSLSREIVSRTCCLLVMRMDPKSDQFLIQAVSSVASVGDCSAVLWLQQTSLAANLVDSVADTPGAVFLVMIRVPVASRGCESSDFELPLDEADATKTTTWARALISHFSAVQRTTEPTLASSAFIASASLQAISTQVSLLLYKTMMRDFFPTCETSERADAMSACQSATLVLPCEIRPSAQVLFNVAIDRDHRMLLLSWGVNPRTLKGSGDVRTQVKVTSAPVSSASVCPPQSSTPGVASEFSPMTVWPRLAPQHVNVLQREGVAEGIHTPRVRHEDRQKRMFPIHQDELDIFGFGFEGSASEFRVVQRLGRRLCICHDVSSALFTGEEGGCQGFVHFRFSTGFASLGVFCTSTIEPLPKRTVLGASLFNVDLNFRKPYTSLTAMCLKGPLTNYILFGDAKVSGGERSLAENETVRSSVAVTVRLCLYPSQHNRQHNEMAKSQLQWFGDVSSGAMMAEGQFMYFEAPPSTRNLVSLKELSGATLTDDGAVATPSQNDHFRFFSGNYVIDRDVVCTGVDCVVHRVSCLLSTKSVREDVYLLELVPVRVLTNLKASRIQQAVSASQGEFMSPGTLFQSYRPHSSN